MADKFNMSNILIFVDNQVLSFPISFGVGPGSYIDFSCFSNLMRIIISTAWFKAPWAGPTKRDGRLGGNDGSLEISYKGPMKWDLAGIVSTIILLFK